MNAPALLRQHKLRPRKRLGQHFLVNEEILAGIAAAAGLASTDVVVEVGAGLGALTVILARQAGHVLAVELDPTLAGKLADIVADAPNVLIVQRDILKLNLEEALAEIDPQGKTADYKVVANLPYYITTPVLRYFFERNSRPSLFVVTVQEEVARRIVAAPPEMNFLAVLVQFYGQPEMVRTIAPGAFYPPPKVDSAVVRIRMHPQPPLEGAQTRQFFRLVSAGFSQARKQLHNPLAQGLGLSRTSVMDALEATGIDAKRRAETLTVAEWLALHQHIDLA